MSLLTWRRVAVPRQAVCMQRNRHCSLYAGKLKQRACAHVLSLRRTVFGWPLYVPDRALCGPPSHVPLPEDSDGLVNCACSTRTLASLLTLESQSVACADLLKIRGLLTPS